MRVAAHGEAKHSAKHCTTPANGVPKGPLMMAKRHTSSMWIFSSRAASFFFSVYTGVLYPFASRTL